MQYLMLALFICLSPVVFAADNELTAEEKEAGWKLLFDGKSIDQWKNFKKDTVDAKWQIIDGALTLTGGGGGDLMTRQTYKNFDFKVDWNISKDGNSGVFILADEKGGKIYSNAPEIQILDDEGSKGKVKPNQLSGSLYDMVAAPAESQKPTGQWNTLRIMLKDKHLQVWQNDVQTVNVVIGSEDWQKLVANSKFKTWKGFAQSIETGGALGLQDHGNKVAFKNIKLKSLD